jgi:hypothetical protein
MQKYSYVTPKAEIKPSSIDSRGVFAKKLIRKGEIVSVFGGYVLTKNEYYTSSENNRRYFKGYAIKIVKGFYLASSDGKSLNDDDYFNHSCNPNCGVNGQILLVAIKDINPGEEMTFDYVMTDDDPEDYLRCNCGTKNCRKIIKGSDWKIPGLQRKYKGFFAWHIQQKIDKQKKK